MKKYKIVINVSDVGGIYDFDSIEEAKQYAQEKCEDIYVRLKGKCSVEIESVEEV